MKSTISRIPANPELAAVIDEAKGAVSVEDVFLVSADASAGLQLHKIGFRLDDLTDPVVPETVAPEPVRPPEVPKDTFFLVDDGPGLDSVCSFRSDGEIVFEIPVTRYVGLLNTDSTLKNTKTLVKEGYLSETATLEIMAYDVDSGADVTAGDPPEIDRVLFNGQEVGFLSGQHKTWASNTFEVPIETVKFPEKGELASEPTPALNEIRIQVDAGNESTGKVLWCTTVAWSNLRFKALSPVVLIHGNNSQGEFFSTNGFTGLLEELNVPFDNSIDYFPNDDFVNATATQLGALLPGVVKTLGVDSVHIVAHSKGGLAFRDYLIRFYPRDFSDFRILSFTTLSTPHNGSVLADLQLARERGTQEAVDVEFQGFPTFSATLSALAGIDAGTRNGCATFSWAR